MSLTYHAPIEVPSADIWIGDIASGSRTLVQYGYNLACPNFQLENKISKHAKPFPEVLQDLWITIQKGLTEQSYQRCSWISPEGCPNLTIQENSLSLQQRWHFWKFFFNVTQLIVDCHCTNLVFMANFLELACEVCNSSMQDNTRVEELICQLQKSCFQKKRQNSTRFEKLMYLPYKFAHMKVDSHFDEVKRAATSGNIGLLEILLKFGVTLLRPEDNFQEYLYTENVIKEVFNKNLIIGGDSGFIIHNLLNEFNPNSRRRLFLMMRVLEVIPKIRFQPEHAHKYVASINLLFKSIPDAMITVEEVENSIKKLCKKTVSKQEISLLCAELQFHFLQSCKPSGLRTLQHLCRSQIRDSLRNHKGCFQVGANSLALPNSLKRYVLLKEGKKSYLTPIMLTEGFGYQRMILNFLYYVLEDRF